MWAQERILDGTEKGQEQWRQFVAAINTPPASAGRVAAGGRAPSRAAAIRAQQEALVGNEWAAFQAYAGKG